MASQNFVNIVTFKLWSVTSWTDTDLTHWGKLTIIGPDKGAKLLSEPMLGYYMY